MKEKFPSTYNVGIPAVFIMLLLHVQLFAGHEDERGFTVIPPLNVLQDTVPQLLDSVFELNFKNIRTKSVHKPIEDIALYGNATIPQLLKGEAAGLYISEPTGEPGTPNYMFIRGISSPIFSNKDVYQSQPLVVLDGIPMISPHPFSYMIQSYDIDRIGPENNLLSNIDVDNIASIEVLKDMADIAIYGPIAANGVIKITSKKSASDNRRRISVNSFVGMASRPQVTTINGGYENRFRQQFYDLYTTNGRYNADDTYPVYLSDSLNTRYYGPSNWSDTYYNNGLNYGINARLSGGGKRSNFQFSLGTLQNSGIAEDTNFKKYNARFQLDLQPLKWLFFHTTINAARLDRNRNKNLRNRYAMLSYLPDLSAPLAPNKEAYDSYRQNNDKGFDNNFSNILEGNMALNVQFGSFKLKSSMSVDYNEGFRDLFHHSSLMERNNFASNYYGYSQRLMYDNVASYDWKMDNSNLFLEAGNVLQWDLHKYNYAYAYKGINDHIKINLLESDPNNDNFLNPTAFPRQLTYKFLDRTRHNLVSFFGRGTYNLMDKYSASLLLRYDGSSNAQPTNRWLFTPSLALGWDIKKEFLQDNDVYQSFKIRTSAGRLGILNMYDNISQGPNYTAQIGYTGNVIVPAYNGIAALVRPYEDGWVGYNIPWAYTDQANVGIDIQLSKRNAYITLDAYIRENKNQILTVPAYAEYGYEYSIEAGMDVRNTGIELAFGGDIITGLERNFRWHSGLNLGANNNKLTALPGGLDEVVIQNRKLKVGERIDAFWILENEGIYQSDAEVPEVDGVKKNYNGLTFKAGDPIWTDQNGDNRISSEDRVMRGNHIPKITGSWQNDFYYKNFDLKVNLYFNLGRQILNQEMANRFDFINNENAKNVNSIKEITYWEKRGDYSKYPLYNPWSSVNAYQSSQDLFLENGAFMKLRQVSLGYNFSDLLGSQLGGGKLYVYLAANNLFTVSNYSGRDPEIVNYLGYDEGYNMVIPRTFLMGFKLNF
ncbi:SusC/RagA family TonB-linked outer membrane protein [Sphingobacterium pedocola]|uniref:SusC/RagA family TonB-linked outer membrane protein n=1 Tax=Sphingobacterium pedocola TaxID=2082722 RepID=A0ABR9T905_9SPHI|nr:SusC/RagA family TonB-linked outer membrane protein [Sphingobacterium pedocola]MBE8721826.1 SusC/RagA family TonB-linked outer membrane protein [Sphingobacterium pedocola]